MRAISMGGKYSSPESGRAILTQHAQASGQGLLVAGSKYGSMEVLSASNAEYDLYDVQKASMSNACLH